jgi:pilus assembly protein Flp/PilA
MIKLFKRARGDESGATAIEYGLIAGIISLAIIAGATQIGANVKTTLSTVANNINK